MEKLKKYKVMLLGTETAVFYGSNYNECETYQSQNGGFEMFHINGMDNNEIEIHPDNVPVLERTQLLGKDIVSGYDVRDNFLIFDKYGVEYHISYDDLIKYLKRIKKFPIEKKRVRRWLTTK